MKYIKNNGRYAIAFKIVKNGKEVKIDLDRQRIYMDTGNIATSGITEVSDEDYEALTKFKRFTDLIESKELELTEKSKVETAETKVASLEKEVTELKAQLKEKTDKQDKKALEAKDKEIADLKAQLEALSNKEDTKETTETTEDKKDETEGF